MTIRLTKTTADVLLAVITHTIEHTHLASPDFDTYVEAEEDLRAAITVATARAARAPRPVTGWGCLAYAVCAAGFLAFVYAVVASLW